MSLLADFNKNSSIDPTCIYVGLDVQDLKGHAKSRHPLHSLKPFPFEENQQQH